MRAPIIKYYPFIEGIRGLTALYVVIHHIWLRLVTTDKLDNLPTVFHLFKLGHAAVAIFIVLSGFCLMLPVIQQAERTLPLAFFLHRARRILPTHGCTPNFLAQGLSLTQWTYLPSDLSAGLVAEERCGRLYRCRGRFYPVAPLRQCLLASLKAALAHPLTISGRVVSPGI